MLALIVIWKPLGRVVGLILHRFWLTLCMKSYGRRRRAGYCRLFVSSRWLQTREIERTPRSPPDLIAFLRDFKPVVTYVCYQITWRCCILSLGFVSRRDISLLQAAEAASRTDAIVGCLGRPEHSDRTTIPGRSEGRKAHFTHAHHHQDCLQIAHTP